LGTVADSLDQLEPYKNQELIGHCKSGRRSGEAQKFLQSKGFHNVRNLIRGIDAYLLSE